MSGVIASLIGSPIRWPFFIFTGESNSGGYAPNSSATVGELSAQSQVQILNNTSLAFEPLHIGVNNLIGHTGLSGPYHGFELDLANAITAGRLMPSLAYLCKTGQGGSVVADWDVAGAYWTAAVSRVSAAKANFTALNKQFVPIIFISLGINDAIAGTDIPTWIAAVQDLLSRWRALVGANTHIIATKFDASLTVRTAINNAWDSIAASDPLTFAIDTTGASNIGDANHWDYAGLKLVTERLIDAALLSNGRAEPPSLAPISGAYSGTQNIVITAPNARFCRYTIDGSDPISGAAPVYAGSFPEDPPITISARAFQYNKASSNVASVVYTGLDFPLRFANLYQIDETTDIDVGYYDYRGINSGVFTDYATSSAKLPSGTNGHFGGNTASGDLSNIYPAIGLTTSSTIVNYTQYKYGIVCVVGGTFVTDYQWRWQSDS